MSSSPFTTLTGWMPHGACFLWDPTLLGLHIISDSVIVLSYLSIPLALLYFKKQGGTLPYKYLFTLFSAFIFACGLTHVLNIWTVWTPDYLLEGLIKSLTAVVSLATAIVLWPVVFKLSALPDFFVLQDSNRQFKQEIDKRLAIEQELRAQTKQISDANEDLLRLNRHLCGRELRMLELKHEVNSLAQALGRSKPYRLNEENT